VKRMMLAQYVLLVAVATTLAACSSTSDAMRRGQPMTLDELKSTMVGEWVSFAPEVRPSSAKGPDGSLRPFYLQRAFRFDAPDRFELTITNFADPYGKQPFVRLRLAGHVRWRGAHPILPGAEKVDFVADSTYEVTPLTPEFAGLLNRVAATGYAPWKEGSMQSVFGKDFVPFGLKAGTDFMEYDLVYIEHGLLFWGARNVDGRGFDSEANRPTNLQIPLKRPG
jgi:hypothetical protein